MNKQIFYYISIIQPSISIINNNINTIKTNPDLARKLMNETGVKPVI